MTKTSPRDTQISHTANLRTPSIMLRTGWLEVFLHPRSLSSVLPMLDLKTCDTPSWLWLRANWAKWCVIPILVFTAPLLALFVLYLKDSMQNTYFVVVWELDGFAFAHDDT